MRKKGLSLVDATLEDLYFRFVREMPGHEKRQELWDGWMRFRKVLNSVGIPYVTWLGGSFFSMAESPKDIDVLIVADAADVGLLPPDLQATFAGLVSLGEDGKEPFGCHIFSTIETTR